MTRCLPHRERHDLLSLGCLGLDVTNVTVVIAAYNLGWSLSNTLTGNDKMVESREIIRASYYVEDALYSILQADREELKNKKDLSSAQKFDASYMLLRTSEMYALQAYKDYLDASEKSFTQGLCCIWATTTSTPPRPRSRTSRSCAGMPRCATVRRSAIR